MDESLLRSYVRCLLREFRAKENPMTKGLVRAIVKEVKAKALTFEEGEAVEAGKRRFGAKAGRSQPGTMTVTLEKDVTADLTGGRVDRLVMTVTYDQNASEAVEVTDGSIDDSATPTMTLTVKVNTLKVMQVLSALQEQLYEVVRHELEHGTQLGSKQDRKFEKYGYRQDDSEVVKAKAYLLDNDEVEAWVVGMMNRAKKQKVPLSRVMSTALDGVVKKLPKDTDPKQVEDLKKTVSDAWQGYARKRFPKMQ